MEIAEGDGESGAGKDCGPSSSSSSRLRAKTAGQVQAGRLSDLWIETLSHGWKKLKTFLRLSPWATHTAQVMVLRGRWR